MKKPLIVAAVFCFCALAFFVLRRPTQAPFPFRRGNYPDLGKIFPAQSRAVFDTGTLTIYALKAYDGGHEGENTFHGFQVLGSAQLSAPQAQELRAAFDENAAKQGMSALCFWPHHGIHAEKNGEQIDLTICFKCGYIYSYGDGKEERNMFSVEGREIFNAIYRRAGVTIDDKWP